MSLLESSRVTYEEVVQAAVRLSAEGERPTLEAVRKQLGNRGSYTTIGKHLSTWREGMGIIPDGPLNDPDLPPQLAAAAISLWNEACLTARAEFLGAREQMEAQLAEAVASERRTREELAAAKNQAESSAIEAAASKEALAALHTDSANRIHELSESHIRERQRDGEKHDSAIQALLERESALNSELVQAKAERLHLVAQLSALARERAEDNRKATELIFSLREKIFNLEAQIEKLTESNRNEVSGLSRKLLELQEKNKRMTRIKRHGAQTFRGRLNK